MKIICCENECLGHIILKSTENRGFPPVEKIMECRREQQMIPRIEESTDKFSMRQKNELAMLTMPP
jgi:hypothetical protein